jgi:phosphatidylglycerophosphatase A
MIDEGKHAAATPDRSLVSRLAIAVATAGGVGFLPLAPGTWGTAVAVPLAWACAGLTWWVYLAVCIAVTLVAIAAAEGADRAFGQHDSGKIVIDEVAGYMVTMVAVDRHRWLLLGAGFLLFRVADVLKPPPARAIDLRMGGGAGVVLDDVAAAVWSAAAVWVVARFML